MIRGVTDDTRADRAAHARLVQRLRDQADDVRRMVAGLDEEALSKRTIPEKWSLKELVCHVLRMQRVFSERLETMLSQENPSFASYKAGGDTLFEKLAGRPGEETVATYLAERERHLERLEDLAPVEWHRSAQHPDFPHYDVHFQTDYLAHHEAHHIYQMLQRRVPFGKLPPEG
jgi:DinB superfamily